MDDATRRSLAQVVQETLRELARNVDRSQRMIAMQLGQIYAMEASQVPGHVERTAHEFGEVRNAILALAAEVPAQEYYKWNETWSWSVRHAVFGACLAYYLGAGRLLSKEEASTVLGMDRVPHDRMLLATDEYLHGLISMVNELPRLAMNAVTSGDFEAPVRIAAFVKQLHAAFQVLNLKNDILRKRFDGLKRVEEIIYDIRLRGLVSDQAAPAPAGDGSALLAIMQGRT